MRYQLYRLKHYLNASTAVPSDSSAATPHTWEFSFEMTRMSPEALSFDDMESQIAQTFASYQGVVLNQTVPFDSTLPPTLENLCEYFKCRVKERLLHFGWLLLLVEISETPNRSYAINLIEEAKEVLSPPALQNPTNKIIPPAAVPPEIETEVTRILARMSREKSI